ncbi:hypothetical protein HRbin17_00077 [bacterium HR17]|uniref:Carboxypeptidase regulatory-like domain-containing protein n=1 Tax=Candidatus Fervidibacter japonicus TaxID=2035412 RepID=A0A2H5X8S5_9BACT|nr:hypothetical protein HRbin17_00077 [bacterium HR17]
MKVRWLLVGVAVSSAALSGCGGLKLPSGLNTPTVPVSGRVLDGSALQDTPIAGVRIVINGSAAAVTDADGRFNVNAPVPTTTPQTIRATLTAAKHGYVTYTDEVQINTSGSNELPPIYLVPAPQSSSLGGRVVERGSGRPIANAEVLLQVNGGTIQRGRTASDGSFLLSGIMPPDGVFEIRARHPNYLVMLDPQTGQLSRSVTLQQGDDRVNRVTIELFPLGTLVRLTGTVLKSETLEPVNGATVRVGDKQATTDSRGIFVIAEAPTGLQVPVQVTPPDTTLAPFSDTITINGELLIIFLGAGSTALPPLPFTVAGQVTLEGETNYSGVRVEALRGDTIVDAAITGVDGRYTLWLPPGTYTLRASLAGFQTVTQTVQLPPGVAVQGVNFTLRRSP